MKNKYRFYLLLLLFVTLNSFEIHKFYVSIYQFNYVPEKKMLQITSRIFIDDLNAVLSEKYGIKTNIGDKNESQKDLDLLQKYIFENFAIKINGQSKTINFISKEVENNIIICYFSCKDIVKLKTFEIQNTILLDLNSDQQNIIQTTFYGKKKSLLLTINNVKGMLKL